MPKKMIRWSGIPPCFKDSYSNVCTHKKCSFTERTPKLVQSIVQNVCVFVVCPAFPPFFWTPWGLETSAPRVYSKNFKTKKPFLEQCGIFLIFKNYLGFSLCFCHCLLSLGDYGMIMTIILLLLHHLFVLHKKIYCHFKIFNRPGVAGLSYKQPCH